MTAEWQILIPTLTASSTATENHSPKQWRRPKLQPAAIVCVRNPIVPADHVDRARQWAAPIPSSSRPPRRVRQGGVQTVRLPLVPAGTCVRQLPLALQLRRQLIEATRTGMQDLHEAVRQNFHVFDREKTFQQGVMDKYVR